MTFQHVAPWSVAVIMGMACEISSQEVCTLDRVDVSEEYVADGRLRDPMCPTLADETEYPAVPLRFVNDTDTPVVLLVNQRWTYVDADPTQYRDNSCGHDEGIEHIATPPPSVVVFPGGRFEYTWLADRWIGHTVPGACTTALSDAWFCEQRVAQDPDALQGFSLAFVGSGCTVPSCSPNPEGWCTVPSCSPDSEEPCTGWLLPEACSSVELRTIPIAFEPSTCGVTEVSLGVPAGKPHCPPAPWCAEDCPVSTAETPLCGLPCNHPGEAACGTTTETLRCVGGLWQCDPVPPDPQGACPPCNTGRLDGVLFAGGCTDAACPTTTPLRVDIPPPLTPGAYRLEVDDTPECTFEIPSQCTQASCHMPWISTCPVRSGGPDGMTLQVTLPWEGRSHLRLFRDDILVAEKDIVPAFDVIAPNGFACSPRCAEATVTIP